MTDIKQLDSAYIAHTYARFPVVLTSGKGSLVYDEDGKEYIDMGAGIGVTAFGIADDEWIAAVTEQLGKIQHTSNLYYTRPAALLAELLCKKTGLSRVFFSNSGAEANECAIKVARKYAAEKKGPEYSTIITMWNSFHGRTLTTLAATGQDHYHELYQPLTPGFVHAEVGNLKSVEKLVRENKVAAILFECVQGEGGVKELPADFIKGLEKIAAREDILLIVDEVQTGNGRSGALYSYMRFGISPDVVTTAKGLGGGLPIGACLIGEKAKDVLTPGDHGSTFGGNPVACAGGVSIISRITDELLAEVRAKSDYAFSQFRGAPGIEAVSGLGLMIGVKPRKPAADVVKRCIELGVLCLTAKDRIRLLPALTITNEQLEKAVAVIKQACAE